MQLLDYNCGVGGQIAVKNKFPKKHYKNILFTIKKNDALHLRKSRLLLAPSGGKILTNNPNPIYSLILFLTIL
jgi:hypothetical protein